MAADFDPRHVHRLIQRARDDRAFPAAAIEVGHARGVYWQHAVGTLTYEADAPPCTVKTIFDLASLTKVIATTSIAMHLLDRGSLRLDTTVAEILPTWRGPQREQVTVRQLLDHSSGLPAHARLWEQARGRAEYERAIAALPLEQEPGTKSLYSDPGFILLGFLIETASGRALNASMVDLSTALDAGITYGPAAHLRDDIAPTEFDAWRGRMIQGEVHDENAAALDGVAGHAGLFGDVASVGAFARCVLATFDAVTALGPPALMRTFATRTLVPDSTRAFGWDTMKATSSCGTRLSSTAIGHTGFTGTSLWIDRERDLYVVLLTNRVHPTRTNTALAALRPLVHDAVVEGLGRR